MPESVRTARCLETFCCPAPSSSASVVTLSSRSRSRSRVRTRSGSPRARKRRAISSARSSGSGWGRSVTCYTLANDLVVELSTRGQAALACQWNLPGRRLGRLMYELWQTEWCPASRRVTQRLTELGIDYISRQVPVEKNERVLLRERTGVDSIPVLAAP